MDDAISIILRYWQDDGERVIEAIGGFEKVNMTFTEFRKFCTPCGGNIGGMILSGIKEIAPDVYNAIPEKMGRKAFECICSVIQLIGIDTSC